MLLYFIVDIGDLFAYVAVGHYIGHQNVGIKSRRMSFQLTLFMPDY